MRARGWGCPMDNPPKRAPVVSSIENNTRKGTCECKTRKRLVLTSTALWSWNKKGTPCSHFLCLSYPPCLAPIVCCGLSVLPDRGY